MTSALLQLPCLGRPFRIGSLYNCYYEKIVPGKILWENAVIQKKHISSNHEIIPQDSLDSKFNSLGVNESLKLSFLAGMVEVSGSAEYLVDRVSSQQQARVTLKYTSTTHTEEVNAEEVSSIQNLCASTEEAATHVVTGILYGSEVVFVFDQSVGSTESSRKISRNLEDLVLRIPKLEFGKISEVESQKVHCTCYGLSLSNPTSFKDIAKIYAELPTLLEEKRVPITVFLHPLKSAIPNRIIASSLTSDVEEIVECLLDAEIQCNDLKKNEHCSKFVDFDNEISSFLNLLFRFKVNFMQKLSDLIPKIRQSISDETNLRVEISLVQQSPFNSKKINVYIKRKKKELQLLCQNLKNLSRHPAIHFISSANTSDLLEITNDYQYENVICFALNTIANETNYFQELKQHLKMKTKSTSDCQTEWFENQQFLKDLRHKSRQFLDFFRLKQRQESLAFIVMDKNEDIESNTRPVILLYRNGVPAYFEPPSRPEILSVECVTDNSITLKLQHDGVSNSMLSYNVHYCVSAESNEDIGWEKNSTVCSKEGIQIKELTPDTEYTFSIEAVCSPFVSSKSNNFHARTAPQFLTRPADNIIKFSNLVEYRSPKIYELPLKLISKDSNNLLYNMEIGSPDKSTRKPERVLMMVGATGAGKSTLINALANYVLGIKWEDTFRFKVVTGEGELSQAHSQTKHITAYTFHQTILPYSLTIIDTPGFGDTSGIDNDRRIAKLIKQFFATDQFKGMDLIHGIGFVTQASLARLTPTQKYIYDAVLSIFGKDVVNNIFLMTTFADANDPPVLEAVKVAKIPYKYSFKFNNSAIFARNDASEKFNHMFWEMGIHSMCEFFRYFSISVPQSLKLTREVLNERERLEALIPGLERQVKTGLSRLDEIQQEERVLQQHEAEINANKNFKYSIKVNKHRKIPLQGVYTTNCLKCSFTCHDNCIYANDGDKIKCCAMNNKGYCTVCPGKCLWSNHSNTPYYFEYYDEYEDRTYDDLKRRYETAQSGKNKTQSMIAANEKILKRLQGDVYRVLDQIRVSIHRLDEIALKPNPLSDIEYIDLLIESERREHKTGWKDRVRQYERIRRDAEVLKKIPKVTVAEKESKTWWRWWF